MGKIDVSRAIKDPGQAYAFETDVTLEPMEVLGDPVGFREVRVAGEYLSPGDARVSVKADVSATADSRCSRCLTPVTFPVTAQVDAVFDRQPDPEDPDLYSFEASTVELTDAVRDALLLELPLRVLCKPDCKGLCPVCGIDLNNGTCTCQEGAEVKNPFSALKDIVLDDEEV
ncbi:MAG: DUF177 domain-containing protein [Clostridia bacterium]|nr:DUF177 domain-containing protein [Clostridia bacterium]